MNDANRLDCLLAVQRRRVDQALEELRARNRQLQQAQLEQTLQQERWQAAENRRKQEIARQAEMVRSHSTQTLPATQLTTSGQRIQWWRVRADEYHKTLQAAEAALLQAHAQAEQARRHFQQADARLTGLLHLVEEHQRAEAHDRLRMEEYDSDDGRACGAKP